MSWLICGNCCKTNAEIVRKLDYSHSLLSEVPSEIYLYERTLEKLYLDSNRIVELPRQLFNCDELRTLNMSDNEINFLPPAISSLINLQKLDISKNVITSLPDNMRSCSCLTVLDISVNPLEKFPESLISLVSLHELYLIDVYLEFLPANFGKLINLRILELRENNLVTLPKTINRLVHLTRLDIGNNDFTELPEVVCSLYNLTELWIDGNHIRCLPQSIGQLRKMIHFEASNNSIELLPRDIGYWTKVVEFSMSNNDLVQLPVTIGNLKNLISLKIDDNQLKTLPDSLGKLVNMEELMINHNYLTYLPTSLGLLRKLQVLTADKNMLVGIPPELGSCTSLSILTLRGNKISEIPAEIGHLSSLRVLNLVDNHLNFLPMSLLKLDKLSALWLSTNQSQPLVPLQQEIHPKNFQTVLTCFMLPQLSHKHTEYSQSDESYIVTRQSHRKHICFASDDTITIEQPGRLTRAPTPYPKELRALAKHAKNIQRGLTVNQRQCNEISMQPIQDLVEIKEAKVTTTPHNVTNGTVNAAKSTNNTQLYEGCNSNPEIVDKTISNTPKQLTNGGYLMSQPAMNSPVIREAVNIRTEMQINEQVIPNNSDMTDRKFHAQPPPYHIAAAYSLQAQYFNTMDNSDVIYDSTSPVMNLDNREDEKLNNYEYKNNNLLNTLATDSDNNQNEKTFEKRDSFNSYTSYNQTDYKPRTFIQDKPLPGQNIIVPTPKRPNEKNAFVTSPKLSRQPSGLPSLYSEQLETKPEVKITKKPSQINKIPFKLSPDGTTKWLFGQHKNVKVEQIVLQKNHELGFSIVEKHGDGIFVDQIVPNGPAIELLKVGDKILEVDGVDFTKLNEHQALDVLLSSGTSISMMVSHTN